MQKKFTMKRKLMIDRAKQLIRVNVIVLGAIATDMLERFAVGREDFDGGKYLASLHPIEGLGSSDEIAETVLFLAGEKASFITSQSIAVDGGLLAQ